MRLRVFLAGHRGLFLRVGVLVVSASCFDAAAENNEGSVQEHAGLVGQSRYISAKVQVGNDGLERDDQEQRVDDGLDAEVSSEGGTGGSRRGSGLAHCDDPIIKTACKQGVLTRGMLPQQQRKDASSCLTASALSSHASSPEARVIIKGEEESLLQRGPPGDTEPENDGVTCQKLHDCRL